MNDDDLDAIVAREIRYHILSIVDPDHEWHWMATDDDESQERRLLEAMLLTYEYFAGEELANDLRKNCYEDYQVVRSANECAYPSDGQGVSEGAP